MKTLRLKKSLGQNFLRSSDVACELVRAGEVKGGDVVVEVGPGSGMVTRELLATGARVIAVEKDRRMIELLSQTFSSEISAGKLALVEADILDFDPAPYKLKTVNPKLVGSLPYYITGQFLRRFLSADIPNPRLIALIIQKEVAERIVAKDGKESILSLSVKTRGVPQYIQTVKRALFTPSPSVDSAILKISNISNDFFTDCDEKRFFELVKISFNQRRKKIAGILKGALKKKLLALPDTPEATLNKCGVLLDARPETLTKENWKCLAKNY